MSSFVGIVRWGEEHRPGRDSGERLRAAVAAPGQGRPVFLSAPPVCVAFRQTIVSPEDGWERQPAVSGDVVSLFDGRIDDREGVADRLELTLGRVPDGALALSAFRRWGADAPREVPGEFAWAVWDGAARRLVLARDISVSRALYVYRSNDVVAFATGLRALFALPEVERAVDDDGLADLITLNPGQGERTPYKNVHRVMPGTTLVIGRDGTRRISNWEPRPVPVPRKPMECAEAAREVFGRAMKARLRTIGPTAVSVSGGLDSAIIAAEAARLRAPDPVLGFALVPPGDIPLAVRPHMAPDDRSRAEALARAHPNLRIGFIVPPDDPVDSDPTTLFVGTGLPSALPPNLGWLLSAWRAARASGARVLMTGDDGEMSLTHGGSLRAMVRQGAVWHALREAYRMSCRDGGGFAGHLDRAFLNGTLLRLRDRKRPRPGDWRFLGALHPDLAASTRIEDRLLAEGFPAGRRHRPLGYAEVVERSLRWRAAMVDNVTALRHLADIDHTSPFADRRVVEFCLSLPEAMFIRDGRPRWLARAAFRDVLPPEVRDNTVKGAQNPEWFHRLTLHRDVMREQLACIESSPLASRALDIPRLKALLDGWPASAAEAATGGAEHQFTLTRALHAGAFLRWLDPGNGG